MLDHTLDRAARLTSIEKIVTVVSEKHCSYFNENTLPSAILKQPLARGTAAGIFYPLSYIRSVDREATVFILPSDHFIHPRDRFIRQLKELIDIVESQPEMLGLVGAEPTGPETDYGWIAPATPRTIGSQIFQKVLGFEEKPNRQKARDYFSRGYLWNTMILVADAEKLWVLGRENIPEVVNCLDDFQKASRLARTENEAPSERQLLLEAYQSLRNLNFSRAFLSRVSDRILLTPLRDILWSDWGRPERVLDTLTSLGKAPAFPISRVVE